MSVKPVLMSDIRKTAPPTAMEKHRASVGAGNYNRFSALATTPAKRKRTDEEEVPVASQQKQPRLDAQVIFDQLKEHDKHMESAKDALSSAATAIGAACKPDDKGIGTALTQLYAAVELLVQGSNVLKSAVVDVCKHASTSVSAGTGSSNSYANAARHGSGGSGSQQTKKGSRPPSETAETKVKKTLRDAEKKMVIFDLDLGTAQTINKTAISRKVTVALHDKVQEGQHDWNITDAGEMIDDVLSCAQLEFLGAGTKRYYNNRNHEDPKNNKCYTVPVRMDFKTRETRIQAEQTIRKLCKVSPSIPYPKRLRAMLSDTVKRGKAMHPDSFIRTKVDIDNLLVKAMIRQGDRWVDIDALTQKIPLNIGDNRLAELDSDMEVFSQVIASEGAQASL